MTDIDINNDIVRIENLSSHYDDFMALDNINLSVHEKEIMVIMGPSGSGKSTLFKNILGLMPPSSGEIEVLGKNLSSLNKKELYELRKKIGVAFQHGALFSSLSVRENIELPLREHTTLDNSTIQIMTRMKLDLMDLADYENLMPNQLSGGMLKRAGLARAVIMDPKLLFFDEPSSGLDPVASAQLDDLILQLRDTLNMTIIIITHEVDSAFHVADRITVLDQGNQIITGTCEEIRTSRDERIVNMLNRIPATRKVNGEDYIRKLTE